MYDEKAKKRTIKYLKKLKTISFRIKKEEYERYKTIANIQGYPSMRQFIISAINEKIKNECS